MTICGAEKRSSAGHSFGPLLCAAPIAQYAYSRFCSARLHACMAVHGRCIACARAHRACIQWLAVDCLAESGLAVRIPAGFQLKPRQRGSAGSTKWTVSAFCRRCVRACCIPHSASSACGCTHLCADLSGGTWLPPFPLFFFVFFHHHHHVEERESKAEGSRAAMQSGADGQASSEMTITNLAVRWHAMCCWMLMQSTRSTTLVQHVSHLYSSTAFPFPLSLTMRHTATPQRRR